MGNALNRRRFLTTISALTGPIAMSALSGKGQAVTLPTRRTDVGSGRPAIDLASRDPVVLPVVEVAPGIHVHSGSHDIARTENAGDICNLGIIIGKTSVAVVDTGGSALVGRRLKATVASLTDLPISHVINTHMHPDHVLGNAAFKQEGVAFVGHHKLPAALAARAEFYLRRGAEQLGTETFAGTEIVMPDMTVTDTQQIDLGGRTLTLTAHPTAHTDNDLTIRDSATDTVLLGDLLFAEHVPTLDGSLVGWLKLIDVLKSEAAAQVVPGHGPATMPWPDAATAMQRYWQKVADGVRQAIADGKTLRQATETVALDERDKWQVFDEHHTRNVGAAYAELEWE